MRFILATTFVLLVSISAYSHHSRTYFQLDVEARVTGTVTQVKWRNPHVRYVLTRVNKQGQMETWSLDGQTPGGYEREGWNEDSIKVGDHVTFIVNPNNKNNLRPPNKQSGLLDSAIKADGTHVPPKSAEGRAVTEVEVKVEEDPTNSFGFSGSTDFSGNWKYYLILDEIKLLGSEAPKHWPLTEKGEAQAYAFDLDDDPNFQCVESGAPRILSYVYDRRWDRYEDRIVISTEATPDDQNRVIWLDGRKIPEDYTPTAIGFSTGRFEEDGSLAVETTGFPSVRWGLESGIDSSEHKRLVERYTLVNGFHTGGTRMIFSVRIEDKEYLTRPVTVHGVYDLAPSREFAKFECDPESASAHLEFN